MIDWDSHSTEILVNPRLPLHEIDSYRKELQRFALPKHVWVATSGSMGRFKWAALPKEGILLSAHAVNTHLQSTSRDTWLHALPDFHVGGMGIWARGAVSGARVIDFKKENGKWCPLSFSQRAIQERITLTALVPTQIYDLVLRECQAPPSLRATLVGGGALTKKLYEKATRLGWKLLPSYGLTECASQVATAVSGQFDEYRILSHMQVREVQQILWVKSDALLTVYALFEKERPFLIDPKEEGWFCTEDRGACLGDTVRVFGRINDDVKISGESVNLLSLQRLAEEAAFDLNITAAVAIFSLPDPRLGQVIHLAVEGASIPLLLKEAFNERVLPYERAQEIHLVTSFPRTDLGKVKRHALEKIISDRAEDLSGVPFE